MKKWLLRGVLAIGALLLVAVVMGVVAAYRFEPYVLAEAKRYMSHRFDSEVQFESLKVGFPMQTPWAIIANLGKGGRIRLSGKGIRFYHKGDNSRPPMFAIKEFHCDIDVNSIFQRPVLVERVRLVGMELNIPPKGQRPKFGGASAAEAKPAVPPPKSPGARSRKVVSRAPEPPAPPQAVDSAKVAPTEAQAGSGAAAAPPVIIRRVQADGTILRILPRDPKKDPLVWDIQKLDLTPSASRKVMMEYDAVLTNAKPPGLVISKGFFGPWDGEEPGDSPLEGEYDFRRADLGVFKGINGKLDSKGKFGGQLNYLVADGEATVPDFSLDLAQHSVRLATRFHAIIDGTNGNTFLDPVEAQLGRSRFTCKGEVAKREGDTGKRIVIDVDMRDARLEDVLFLAMKGDRPFMRGPLRLFTTLEIPPGPGTIAQRLRLHRGKFQIIDAHFTSPTVQQKIDEFSRRAQSQQAEEAAKEVPVRMKGEFALAAGRIAFSSLGFEVPGAQVELAGDYAFLQDAIDFAGNVRLDAKVSQVVGGWKGAMLKPADPFFSKRGAGTYLPVKISGSREKVDFGLVKSSTADKRLKRAAK